MEPAQVAIYIAVIVIIIIILVVLGFWFCGSWYSSPTVIIVDENNKKANGTTGTTGTAAKTVDKEVLDIMASMNQSENSEDDSFIMSGESGRDEDELVSILPSENPEQQEEYDSKDILSRESLEFESEENSYGENRGEEILKKDLPESSSWSSNT